MVTSPTDATLRKKGFAPLVVPMRRRMQTLTMIIWLTSFFGPMFFCAFVAVVYVWFAHIVFQRASLIYDNVYGGTVFYSSDKDKEELHPQLADFFDPDTTYAFAIFAILTVSLLGLFIRIFSSRWYTMGRRGHHRRAKGVVSATAEVPKATFLARLAARYVVWYSRHYCGFFPHRVVFDDEDVPGGLSEDQIKAYFPNDRNYLLAYHPHGLIGIGLWTAFGWRPTCRLAGTEPNPTEDDPYVAFADTPMRRFLEKYVIYSADSVAIADGYPGSTKDGHNVPPKKEFTFVIHTLSQNFFVPLWRELVLYLGFRDVSKSTLMNNLAPVEADDMSSEEKEKSGHKMRMSILVPGGAAESIDCAQPGLLTLKHRKGFIKVCVETGSAVVPIYAFGETELYDSIFAGDVVDEKKRQQTLSVRIQRKIQKTMGFALPLAIGRGVFNYSVGAIPRRHPVVTVVGKPIQVRKIAPPPRPHKGADRSKTTVHSDFEAEVEKVHAEYVLQLQDLYRRYQPIHDPTCPIKELRVK